MLAASPRSVTKFWVIPTIKETDMRFLPMSLGVQHDGPDLHAITSVVSNHFRVTGNEMIGATVTKYRTAVGDNQGFDEPRVSTIVATVRTAYGMEAEVKLIDIVANFFYDDHGYYGTYVAFCEGAVFMNSISKQPLFQELRPHLVVARIALQVAKYLYGEDRPRLSPEVLSKTCLTLDTKGTVAQ